MSTLAQNSDSTQSDTAQVRVELYGIPRARAGVSEAQCQPGTLASILQQLAQQFPAFGESCLEQGRLRKNYLANLGGNRFLTDLNCPVAAGQTLLILSADAGG